ncbi:radical SAM protein [Helicobacter sp. MIT 00-7814]|uniref:radical SAM protein n=1 Tax=unclassified Helicobacter TaxID=2593540 RepID=UPI000E1E8A23|nr:radical SAM protein [Helicobacter sp. MIT 99-10781]RDU52886.1 radical SAM protein [Helicobacter sp. MIT 00-7814]
MANNNFTFGPILSRRFGYSLGVDLSPSLKQCNFDCLYCELKPARAQDSMQEVAQVPLVIEQIAQTLHSLQKSHAKVDVLTFTANGEPTLYPHLYELIMESKKILATFKGAPFGNIKTLILSNGSLFWKKEVQKALLEFDMVKFSLDSLNERIFKRVDRAHKSLDIAQIKEGIAEFSRIFKGALIGEILLVKGVNDDMDSARELAGFLQSIAISRLDIGTIDRPSAHKATPLTQEEIEHFASVFENICVCLPQRNPAKQSASQEQNALQGQNALQAQSVSQESKQELNKDEILAQIARRPLSKEDLQILYSPLSQKRAQELVDSQMLAWVKVGSVSFLKCVK